MRRSGKSGGDRSLFGLVQFLTGLILIPVIVWISNACLICDAFGQTTWILRTKESTKPPTDDLEIVDVTIPVETMLMEQPIIVTTYDVPYPAHQLVSDYLVTYYDCNQVQQTANLKVGGIAVDKIRGGVWVTDGDREGNTHRFDFIPFAVPINYCDPAVPASNYSVLQWDNVDNSILGMAVDTVHGFECGDASKFLWLLTYTEDTSSDPTNYTLANELTYWHIGTSIVNHEYRLDRWPSSSVGCEDEVPFVDIAYDPTLGDKFWDPQDPGSNERPTGVLWAIDAAGVVEAFEVNNPLNLTTVVWDSMGRFDIDPAITSGFEGIALDLSLPMELDHPLVRGTGAEPNACDNPPPGSLNKAGGRILGLHEDGIIYALAGPNLPEETWSAVGNGTYLGFDYSAEAVRFGHSCPNGLECGMGGGGGAPRIDLRWPQASYPDLCDPVTDPLCTPHQAQPLVPMTFAIFKDDDEEEECLPTDPRNYWITDRIVVEACLGNPQDMTPYLMRSSKQNPAQPVGGFGAGCAIYPDLTRPGARIYPGGPPGYGINPLEHVLSCGYWGGLPPTPPPDNSPMPWMDPCEPIRADGRNVEYLQWVFMCGGTNVPFNLTSGPKIASDAIRISWSNR